MDGARDAQRSWELAARAGYVVTGVLHVLIGGLALQVAFGDSSQSADQSGALGTIATTPFGSAVLWCSVLAFVALGGWQLARAVGAGSPGRSGGAADGSERAKAAGRAAVYLVLAVTAFSFARGGGSDSSSQTTDLTSRLMSAPGGRFLVAAVGVAVVAVGGYHVVKGVRTTFLDDLRRLPAGAAGTTVRWLGITGYVAKGVALVVVGVLFVVAAATADPSKSTGLDGAVHTLRGQPAGVLLLVIVAVGLVAYGAYSFARARFGRI